MTAILCRNLVKRYDSKPPVDAVRGLDLHVERGQCFGLLGPNGAGKTTTIEILEGLLPATSGEVQILGLRWGEHDDQIKQQIGISLQETKLSEKLTVLETATLFRSLYRQGITPEQAIAHVSLQEKANSRVGKLSGGQKQRLAVACAIVGDPQLLFLDEPTTGLDPASRRQLWDIIRGFRQQGRTVLLTTHYMDEAEKLCDQVAIVDHGKVIALGTPQQLIASLGAEMMIEIDFAPPHTPHSTVVDQLRATPGVSEVKLVGQQLGLSVSNLHLVLPTALAQLERANCPLTGLRTHQASLEDVFVKLAGRHLSEESSEDV
ncbi:MAG: ABC transporter ATP-binding protein [Planctomycetota bacterium]|nr:ABC transporter ATP-binding protein [Planctomycetota bacterium]